MKKTTLILLLCLIGMTATAQTNYILPGKGQINVEKLGQDINTDMDISQLSISELRVLRNAFAAQQGYIFMAGELRSLFASTSWYSDRMWERFNKEEELGHGYDDNPNTLPLNYTLPQQRFIQRLKARESELLKKNFEPEKDGYRVNTKNIINPYQLESFDPRLEEALGRNGFAIVPENKDQLFHIYEKNDYHCFPSFVTTDLYLQMFHFYFDCVLREVEEEHFVGTITTLCQQLYDRMGALAASAGSKEERAAAEYNQTFAAVGLALITDQPLKDVPEAYREMAAEEVDKVKASENDNSEYLGYIEVMFPYSLFRPRGHYTRSEAMQRYFRAMMWLQTVPFGTDNPHQLNAALQLAEAVGSNADILKNYNRVYEPITFLMGSPDNITVLQVYELMQKTQKSCAQLLKDKKSMKKLRSDIETLAQQQIRIRPKFEKTSPYKINLMPQRYQPDAEVLNEMIDAKSEISLRGCPMGLDVFAALQCPTAESILVDELRQDEQWPAFLPTLHRMKNRMGEIKWQENVATRWIDALKTMATQQDSRLPYFMATPQWGKKNMNTALASWAELKHDAILYAKQPAGAECGAGGPPDPIVKGYVEPNVPFWQKALSLIDATEAVIEKYNLITEKVDQTTNSVREQAEFFLNISQKELNGQPLTDEEYQQIEIAGANIEYISLDLVRNKDQYLDGWNNVEGTDKSISVIADVYTANADNNPKGCVLYEGVGPAYEIYVVVPVGKYLYLMRGGVFSYREFDRPLHEQRLTDEEWQEMLKQYPTRGIPSWMDEITVPLQAQPEDNEEVFYSSGC